MPAVTVRYCVRKPISPRAGMRYSSRMRPLAVGHHVQQLALAIGHARHHGALVLLVEIERHELPGLAQHTVDFAFDDRRASTRRVRSPRAASSRSAPTGAARRGPTRETCPGSSSSSTRSATLCLSSVSRRSLICRLVRYLPSRPAKGDLLTWKVMLIVGSSTFERRQCLRLASRSQSVSEICRSSMPLNTTMSPAPASCDLDALEAVETVEFA